MKTKIKTTAFNGALMLSEIEIHIGSVSVNECIRDLHNPVSTRIYSDSQAKILTIFKKAYPNIVVNSVDFTLISRDLESLYKAHIVPDAESLSDALESLFFKYIAHDLGLTEATGEIDIVSSLTQKEMEFQRKYLKKEDPIIKNPSLRRAIDLFQEKRYVEAWQLLNSVHLDLSTDYEKQEANLLLFSLKLKNEVTESGSLKAAFSDAVRRESENPSLVKRYYFEYIRYLENIRDQSRPREVLEEFENKYPLSILTDTEKALYFYLKGRSEYARGEYLDSLSLLTQAMVLADKSDKYLLASIYNTSVNPFADNLFFEEAIWIANRSMELRSLLDIPEAFDTLSCLAGIDMKRTFYSQALKSYLEVEKKVARITQSAWEENRLFNYIAKSAILTDQYHLADEYLAKAEKAGDFKGFSKMIRLLGLLKQKQYDEMNTLFKTSLMLPEHHDALTGYDNFALGWGYTFMAQAACEQNRFKDGLLYLTNAMTYFLDDMYILEARYVSLYAYQYAFPEHYMKVFSEILTDNGMIRRFEEYVEKHGSLDKNYYRFYCDVSKRSDIKSNLVVFADQIRGINEFNFNPEEIQEILSSICLV